MAYVYRHIRLDTNEPFYIGIGVGNRHKQKSGRNRHWTYIVKKYGFYSEIMLDDLTWDECCEKEKEFIKLYGRRDKKTGCLVNLTDGGEGMLGWVCPQHIREKLSLQRKGKEGKTKGYKHTKEAILKMSLANKGHKRNNGRILSNETKEKLRKKAKNQKNKRNIPIIQYSLDGVFIKEWFSAVKAASYINSSNGALIAQVCKGRVFQHYGFIWRYKKDVLDFNGEVLMKIKVIKKIKKQLFLPCQIDFILKSKLRTGLLSKMFGVCDATILNTKKRYQKNETGN